jgi:hypothetical protein
MTEPRTITETVTIEWRVVAGPIRCDCGHDHYGRTDGDLAPQWRFCEDETCGCHSLRRTWSS